MGQFSTQPPRRAAGRDAQYGLSFSASVPDIPKLSPSSTSGFERELGAVGQC
jgi:hypothetical protein